MVGPASKSRMRNLKKKKPDHQTTVTESDSKKILGIEIQNTLEPESHLSKLKTKVNYGLGKLKRLQNQMRTKHLKMIGQGLIMSNINYGIQIYNIWLQK